MISTGDKCKTLRKHREKESVALNVLILCCLYSIEQYYPFKTALNDSLELESEFCWPLYDYVTSHVISLIAMLLLSNVFQDHSGNK